MDPAELSVRELFIALREADWGAASLRPPAELLQHLNVPPSRARWEARLRSNAYLYRHYYAAAIAAAVLLGFARRPGALAALAAVVAGVVLLSDAAATGFSERATRVLAHVHPPAAAKVRALAAAHRHGPGPPGAPPRGHEVVVLGAPRGLLVAVLELFGLLFLVASGALSRLVLAAAVGAAVAGAHGSMRAPNLKARVTTHGGDLGLPSPGGPGKDYEL